MFVEVIKIALVVALLEGAFLLLYTNNLKKQKKRYIFPPIPGKHCEFLPRKASNILGVRLATQKKLKYLCKYDYRAVCQIIHTIHDQYPSKSPQWCCEKAIRNIKRSRIRPL